MSKNKLSQQREKAFERILTDVHQKIEYDKIWCKWGFFNQANLIKLRAHYSLLQRMSRNEVITQTEKNSLLADPMFKFEKFLTTYPVAKHSQNSKFNTRLFSQPHPFEVDQSIVYPFNRRP